MTRSSNLIERLELASGPDFDALVTSLKLGVNNKDTVKFQPKGPGSFPVVVECLGRGRKRGELKIWGDLLAWPFNVRDAKREFRATWNPDTATGSISIYRRKEK